MDNLYFTILSNDVQKRVSILGTLSPNEESIITHMIATLLKNGIKCQRNSYDLNRSISQVINDYLENNPNYEFVPVNDLFDSKKFIQIPNVDEE